MVGRQTSVDAVAAAYQVILDAVPLVDRVEMAAALAVGHGRHRAEIAHELADHAAAQRRRRAHGSWSPADIVAAIHLFHHLADPLADRRAPLWAVLARRVVLALREALLRRRHRLDQPIWLAALEAQPGEFVADYGARLLSPRGTRGFAYLGLDRSLAWFEDHCRRHLDEHAATIWPDRFERAAVPFADEPMAHQAAAAAWERLLSLFDGRRGCAVRFWLVLRLRLAHGMGIDGGQGGLPWDQAGRLLDRLAAGERVSSLDDDDLPPGVTWAEARAALTSGSCEARALEQFWGRAAALLGGEVLTESQS